MQRVDPVVLVKIWRKDPKKKKKIVKEYPNDLLLLLNESPYCSFSLIVEEEPLFKAHLRRKAHSFR